MPVAVLACRAALADIGTSLPLAEMYERVDFLPEADEEA